MATHASPSSQQLGDKDAETSNAVANMSDPSTEAEDTPKTLDQISTSWLSLEGTEPLDQLLAVFEDVSETGEEPGQDIQS